MRYQRGERDVSTELHTKDQEVRRWGWDFTVYACVRVVCVDATRERKKNDHIKRPFGMVPLRSGGYVQIDCVLFLFLNNNNTEL